VRLLFARSLRRAISAQPRLSARPHKLWIGSRVCPQSHTVLPIVEQQQSGLYRTFESLLKRDPGGWHGPQMEPSISLCGAALPCCRWAMTSPKQIRFIYLTRRHRTACRAKQRA